MTFDRPLIRSCLLVGVGLLALGTTGCQSTVGGQTLPSAFYLRDDVQFFPAGPEFKLTRQVEALSEYKLRQQATAGPTTTLPSAPQ